MNTRASRECLQNNYFSRKATKTTKINMNENELSKLIVDAAYSLHTKLGPGLLESVYEELFVYELYKRNLSVQRQVELPVWYDGKQFNSNFRIDVLVEKLVIVELKSVETIQSVHKKQLLTYLKLSNKKLGLLVNFGSALIKNGIFRIVNNLEDKE